MNETLGLLIKDGGAVAALIVVLLIVKAIIPTIVKKNGNGGDRLTEKRIADLEIETSKIHAKIMPVLRWHDSEIQKLGGEASKTLNS